MLPEILRVEWGFDGYVMSDWGAVNDRVKGLEAGLELEMPASGGVTDAEIVAAVKEGRLDEAVLDRAVERILEVLFRYADNREQAVFDRDAHHQLAAELEKECAVLLKNQGVLPLKRSQKIAYIGGFAKNPRFQGGGSSHINSSHVSNALDCALAKGHVEYALGFAHDKDEVDEALQAEAVEAARKADVAVIFAGLPDSFESEGYDRTHMQIPACQNRLIEQIAAVQPNTVVVLHNGSPVELPWADKVSAILEMYLGGQGVGIAADALLFGEANPCGHLPETFPMQLEDNPSYLNFPGDGKHVKYAEGVFVGYRYYDKKKMAVRFPFGHGLSYTTFAYSNLRLSSPRLEDGGKVTVQLDITNTGLMAGKAVAQLYVRDLTGTACRPDKELKGFEKVMLRPGECRTVSMELDGRSLSWYSEELGDWYAAAGKYQLLVGASSADIRLTGEVEFVTSRRLPFAVTPTTTLGEIMAEPRLAPFVSKMIQSFNFTGDQDSEVASAAVNAEMAAQMMAGMPLRSLRSFGSFSSEQLSGLIDQLNGLLAQ